MKLKGKYKNYNPVKLALIVIFTITVVFSCTNPFAPGLADMELDAPVISDQMTPEGVFENFRYAYIFRDTLVYGQLLADDFTFIYRNYDDNLDYSWGRDEDMYTTAGLFRGTQSLDLVWNDILVDVRDTLVADISRSFNLSVVFSPDDIIDVQGIASLRLSREDINSPWKITRWRDVSNY